MTLHDRMKQYESLSKTFLEKRTPVIIRIDGKAFHTWTAKLKKPFDQILYKSMVETTKYLCANIQNCVLGYTASDEITLILIDTNSTKDVGNYFDNQVQKICSVSASMATLMFNKYFDKFSLEYLESLSLDQVNLEQNYLDNLECAVNKGAMFDARCFNISNEDIISNLIWRQRDTTRNAISALSRCYFSQKALNNLNSFQQIELLNSKNINFESFPTHYKLGVLIVKEQYDGPNNAKRTRWIEIDETPIFSNSITLLNELLSGEFYNSKN